MIRGRRVTALPAARGRRRAAPARALLCLTLLGVTAACGQAGPSGAPAHPPPGRIPASPGLYGTIPAACSLLGTAALRALGVNPRGKAEPTRAQDGVQEKSCSWGSPVGARSGSRLLIVTEDLFTAAAGQAPARTAQDQLQADVSDQSQADGNRARPVASLVNEAFINQVARPGLGESQVHARDQNVLLTVAYGGATPTGGPASLTATGSGVLAAARAALAALGRPPA